MRTFPHLVSRLRATLDGLEDNIHEQQLGQAEGETTDTGDFVKSGKLHRVVRDAARHTGQAQEVLGEEQDIDRNSRQPEVQLAQFLVVHVTGPLRHPVVGGAHNGKHRACNQYVMEMRHHEIGVMVLEVYRRHRQHQPGESTDGEHHNEPQREQHRRLEGHGTSPHRGNPVEHLDPCRHRNQHGRVHEEQLPGQRHTHGKHVVSPDDERQERDRRCRIDHRAVAKQRLARKGGNDLRNDAEGRQNQNVDFRVTEEPEDMLEHHRIATAGGVKERRIKETVRQQHGHRTGEHRHGGDQQVGGDQPCPYEQRHLHHGHARRAHIDNGDDDVDGTHDGRNTHQVDGENQEREGITGLQHQRRIHGPATGRCATVHEQRAKQDRKRERQDPETPVVHARQGHVRRTDHHRNQPVRQAHKGRHHRTEDHHQRVHRGHGIEELRLDELQPRLEQLGADNHCHRAADDVPMSLWLVVVTQRIRPLGCSS